MHSIIRKLKNLFKRNKDKEIIEADDITMLQNDINETLEMFRYNERGEEISDEEMSRFIANLITPPPLTYHDIMRNQKELDEIKERSLSTGRHTAKTLSLLTDDDVVREWVELEELRFQVELEEWKTQ